ncbi:MAG: outer membrane lipoprotein-sorting protein [Candidatus Adiutricales bacterium]
MIGGSLFNGLTGHNRITGFLVLPKISGFFCLVMTLILSQNAPLVAQAGALTPREILDKVDDLSRGKSSRGKMTMSITTAHWSRSLTLEFWNKGKDKSLIRILSPKKEKGMTTLRSGNNIWNYLPKINRIIKLPSSMMGSSWMGSHFSNDDLIKESRMADDYTFEISFQGQKEGRRVVEITCIPHEDAVVVWGRIIVTVDSDEYLPLKILYYDEDLELARTMIFEDVGLLGGRKLPRRMVIIPAAKPKEATVVLYEEMQWDIELDDKLFSIRSLKR